METRHTVATASVLSVVGVAVVVAAAVGVSPAVLAQVDNETTDDEASFGAQMSAFAQATAADANATVDSGMWAQRVNASENPGQAVRNRATDLEQRLAALRNRTDHLEAARANESISGVTYTARAGAVHAELANLREQMNETSQVAARVGVNATKLAELRAAAGNATGPEMAAIARNVTDAGQGPPPWAGNGGQSGPADHPANGSAGPPDDSGPPGNGTGPPGNGTGQSGNESGGGPNSGGGPDGGPGTGTDGGPSGPETGPGGPSQSLVDLAQFW